MKQFTKTVFEIGNFLNSLEMSLQIRPLLHFFGPTQLYQVLATEKFLQT